MRAPIRTRSLSLSLAAAILLGVAAGLPLQTTPGPAPAAANGPADQAAAQAHLAATRGGSPGDWQPVHETSTNVPRSNEPMWAGKFRNVATGEVASVYRNSSGQTGGEELFRGRAAEVLAALDPFDRKADQALRDAVGRGPHDRSLAVAIWLTSDTTAAVNAVIAAHPEIEWAGDRPLAGDLATIRALRGELHEARRLSDRAALDAFSAQVRAHGGRVAYASSAAPLVFVDMPAGRLRALAHRAEIESMGLERRWIPTMSSAGPTVSANWTTGSGDQGTGVRVAVIEYQNVRNTGDLSGQVVASYSTTGQLAYSGAGVIDHPSWVAGAIASRNATHPGVAPGADIVSASTGGNVPGLQQDRDIVRATDWSIAPSGGDADIVNTSLVQDTATGAEETRRYFDSIVWEDGRLAVSASGNYSALGTWNVGSPGTGYNVLTVGGSDDRGTSSWSDDRLWYVPGSDGASYIDPRGTAWNPHGDFNKPNVTAPAVNVTTANGMAASGTSVATPIVSGIAAQLVANQPAFATWPEAVRAIIMASAVHHTPLPGGGTNRDHEGVGTVSALWANRIRTSGDSLLGGNVYGSMTTGQTVTQSISVQAGQLVRVALAWDSHTGGSNNLAKSDTLTADLDLAIVQPNGSTLGSYSIDNSYEFVEFRPSSSGTVTIRVRQARFTASSEPYALAWMKEGGDQVAPKVSSRTPAPGATSVSTTTTVQAVFSEPVTGVSTSTFALWDSSTGRAVPATVSYDAAARRATLRPSAPLALSRTYNAELTSRIRDVGGNVLPYTRWNFTTSASDASAPRLTSRTPAVNATGVSNTPAVQVVFSEPVTGVSTSSFALWDTATGRSVPSTVSYDAAARRATLRPSAPLTLSRTYKAELTSRIRDASGNPLPYTRWNFRVAASDTFAPSVIARSPGSGATGVSATATVTVTFNEPVTGVWSGSFSLWHVPSEQVVPASVVYDAASRTATLTPSVPLAPATQYKVELTSRVRDAAGNALAYTRWTFTTQ